MAEKNKPCPKCNSLIYRVVKVSGWFRLECGCGIMFNPFVNTEAEMWQKWNHRPQIKETKLKSDNTSSDAIVELYAKWRVSAGKNVDATEVDNFIHWVQQQHTCG